MLISDSDFLKAQNLADQKIIQQEPFTIDTKVNNVDFDTCLRIYLRQQDRWIRKFSTKHRQEANIQRYLRFYHSGQSIWSIATHKSVNFSPYLIARIMLERLLDVKKRRIYDLIREPSLIPDERLRKEVIYCCENDLQVSPGVDRLKAVAGVEGEYKLYRILSSRGIPFDSETDVKRMGFSKTPDALLRRPIVVMCPLSGCDHRLFNYVSQYSDEVNKIRHQRTTKTVDSLALRMTMNPRTNAPDPTTPHGHIVCWIDSKGMFADESRHSENFPQLVSYLRIFGPGLVLYWPGFCTSIAPCLGGGSFPYDNPFRSAPTLFNVNITNSSQHQNTSPTQNQSTGGSSAWGSQNPNHSSVSSASSSASSLRMVGMTGEGGLNSRPFPPSENAVPSVEKPPSSVWGRKAGPPRRAELITIASRPSVWSSSPPMNRGVVPIAPPAPVTATSHAWSKQPAVTGSVPDQPPLPASTPPPPVPSFIPSHAPPAAGLPVEEPVIASAMGLLPDLLRRDPLLVLPTFPSTFRWANDSEVEAVLSFVRALTPYNSVDFPHPRESNSRPQSPLRVHDTHSASNSNPPMDESKELNDVSDSEVPASPQKLSTRIISSFASMDDIRFAEKHGRFPYASHPSASHMLDRSPSRLSFSSSQSRSGSRSRSRSPLLSTNPSEPQAEPPTLSGRAVVDEGMDLPPPIELHAVIPADLGQDDPTSPRTRKRSSIGNDGNLSHCDPCFLEKRKRLFGQNAGLTFDVPGVPGGEFAVSIGDFLRNSKSKRTHMF